MTKRWSETQHLGAEWFRERGWPFAEAVGNGRMGRDITGMPGLAPEVKATDRMQMLAWLRQASKEDGLPFVVWRPPNYGPTKLHLWPVTVRLEDFTALLHYAGFGTKED